MVSMMALTGGPSTYNALMAIARRTSRERLASVYSETDYPSFEKRKRTSGGPRDRAAHLAYQREYQKTRRTRYGVQIRTADGRRMDRYFFNTRGEADKVRATLRAFGMVGAVASDAVKRIKRGETVTAC